MKKFALTKKVVVSAMAVGLLALAACGGTSEAEAPTTETNAPVVQDTATPPAPVVNEPSDDEPTPVGFVQDMEGRVITSASWWNVWGGNETGSEPPDPATSTNYFIDRLQWDNMRRIEQQFNVSFDYTLIPQGEMVPVLLSSVMAGDSPGDVVYLLGGMAFASANGDLLSAVSNFAPANADIFNAQLNMRPRNQLNGEFWNFSDTSPMVHGMGLGVNLDIINAIGAPNPVDLFNAGEWTWDAMREIMIMATRDTTGDGSIDQFGISGQPNNIMINLIAANNGNLVNPDTLTYGFGDPNTVEAFEFIHEIFNTLGAWYYDTTGDPMGDWGRNTFSYRDGRSALFTAATWMLQGDDLPFEYAMVPYPMGPSGGPYHYARMYGFASGYGIPVTVHNPGDVFRIMEEVMAWPGDEPELRTMAALDYARPAWLTEDDVWRAIYVGDHVKTDLGMVIYGYYWVLGTFAYYFHHGHMTVAQAIETYRPQQQEMIDLVFRSQE